MVVGQGRRELIHGNMVRPSSADDREQAPVRVGRFPCRMRTAHRCAVAPRAPKVELQIKPPPEENR